MSNVTDVLGEAAEIAAGSPSEGDLPMSPARKAPGRPVRNVGQMGTEKFEALMNEMEDYAEVDPDAYAAIQKEKKERGL